MKCEQRYLTLVFIADYCHCSWFPTTMKWCSPITEDTPHMLAIVHNENSFKQAWKLFPLLARFQSLLWEEEPQWSYPALDPAYSNTDKPGKIFQNITIVERLMKQPTISQLDLKPVSQERINTWIHSSLK